MAIVLTETTKADVPSNQADALWLNSTDVEAATGWTLKPEGFCQGDICVPIPPGREAEFAKDDQVNVSTFWAHMNKPAVASEAGDVWFLGEGAESRNDTLLSLEAPDFTLPDLEGNMHSLTDFRGKRVLLATWASW